MKRKAHKAVGMRHRVALPVVAARMVREKRLRLLQLRAEILDPAAGLAFRLAEKIPSTNIAGGFSEDCR